MEDDSPEGVRLEDARGGITQVEFGPKVASRGDGHLREEGVELVGRFGGGEEVKGTYLDGLPRDGDGEDVEELEDGG